MFDLPETLIIVLLIAILVLGTRHWLTTASLDRGERTNNKANRV